jgi:hypothetical protein
MSMAWSDPLLFLKDCFPRYTRAMCSPGVPVRSHPRMKELAPVQSGPAPNWISNIVQIQKRMNRPVGSMPTTGAAMRLTLSPRDWLSGNRQGANDPRVPRSRLTITMTAETDKTTVVNQAHRMSRRCPRRASIPARRACRSCRRILLKPGLGAVPRPNIDSRDAKPDR